MDSGDGDAQRAVARVWGEMEAELRRVAQRLTENRDEQDDLLQEALVELWRTDPTRYDLRRRNERRFLRRVLVNRMWKVWKAERARSCLES